MTPERKYLLAAALLGWVLLPVLLMLCLQLGQQAMKALREERFFEKTLQSIQVRESAVVWEEKGRELRIDGRFFDVISWHSKDGILYLTGHFDAAETKLWQMISQSAGQQKDLSLFRLVLLLQCLPPLLLLSFLFGASPIKISWARCLTPQLRNALLPPPYCPPRLNQQHLFFN